MINCMWTLVLVMLFIYRSSKKCSFYRELWICIVALLNVVPFWLHFYKLQFSHL